MENTISGKAIPIIVPTEEHKFEFKKEALKGILGADEIKDRQIVVVSIAGAFRKGKSFLLNFFLKYLYAKYKKNDVRNWIGNNENRYEVNGFPWRGGQDRETVGISIWSEIFTHNNANGEKIAIILMDTQGAFDHTSTVKDCTVTFAISTILSSVQLMNVSQQIQENDLQHLQLSTQYGLIAMDDSKPFQKLRFIIRDWQNPHENQYGNSPQYVDRVLSKKDGQTNEMHQLRTDIESVFDEIEAFLMPYPGEEVATCGPNPSKIKININFINSVQELTESIFAPEKLIVKEINGQKLRADRLVGYLEKYVELFNDNKSPEPKSILEATAERYYNGLSEECMEMYTSTMKKLFDDAETYFEEEILTEIHKKNERAALDEFKKSKKLGSLLKIDKCQIQLEEDIADKYKDFQEENQKIKESNSSKKKSFLYGMVLGGITAAGAGAAIALTGATGGAGAAAASATTVVTESVGGAVAATGRAAAAAAIPFASRILGSIKK